MYSIDSLGIFTEISLKSSEKSYSLGRPHFEVVEGGRGRGG
jgi:hypothetical protein